MQIKEEVPDAEDVIDIHNMLAQQITGCLVKLESEDAKPSPELEVHGPVDSNEQRLLYPEAGTSQESFEEPKPRRKKKNTAANYAERSRKLYRIRRMQETPAQREERLRHNNELYRSRRERTRAIGGQLRSREEWKQKLDEWKRRGQEWDLTEDPLSEEPPTPPQKTTSSASSGTAKRVTRSFREPPSHN